MDVPAPLTGQQRARLASIRQRDDDTFRTRVPKSLALGMRARELMPSGVPMAWMAGYYRTPMRRCGLTMAPAWCQNRRAWVTSRHLTSPLSASTTSMP